MYISDYGCNLQIFCKNHAVVFPIVNMFLVHHLATVQYSKYKQILYSNIQIHDSFTQMLLFTTANQK